jgi:hypothetical protein
MSRVSLFAAVSLLLLLNPSTPALADWQSKVSPSVLDDPDLEEHGHARVGLSLERPSIARTRGFEGRRTKGSEESVTYL